MELPQPCVHSTREALPDLGRTQYQLASTEVLHSHIAALQFMAAHLRTLSTKSVHTHHGSEVAPVLMLRSTIIAGPPWLTPTLLPHSILPQT